MTTAETARSVKRQVEAQLLRLPGVTGVAVGPKYVGGRRTNQISIRVYVARKRQVPTEQMIPPSIDGVPTDVIQRRFTPASSLMGLFTIEGVGAV